MKRKRQTFLLIVNIIIFNCCIVSKSVVDDTNKTDILDTTYSNLPILHLNGTPYENGYQHGAIMKSRIIKLIELWKKDIEDNYQVPADEFIKTFLDSTDYISFIKKWNPDLLDEIKGIGIGVEVGFNTILAFQLLDEIWANARLINLPHHCTSVGVNNYKKDGSPNYIAQTVDITPFYHDFGILLDIKDKDSDSRKFVFTFAGFVGINGLNKNIGIIGNTVLKLKSSLNGIPVCCIVRCILEKKSFDEAVNFLKEIKHASGANYIIGSRNNLNSLECAADLVTEYWPDTTKLYTYHANEPLTNTSYHQEYLKNLNKNMTVTILDSRFKLMESSILNNKAIDLVTIEKVLSKKPICNNNTWVSVVMEFNNYNSKLRITPGKPDSTKYIELKIEK